MFTENPKELGPLIGAPIPGTEKFYVCRLAVDRSTFMFGFDEDSVRQLLEGRDGPQVIPVKCEQFRYTGKGRALKRVACGALLDPGIKLVIAHPDYEDEAITRHAFVHAAHLDKVLDGMAAYL